ncbi:MAG: histidine kinase dimerization/phosphoacceptor domain-containing protein, partial [Microlunatus sp.]|nr:histidine kinase dimerization/phosphoacceptor domain-containing protein [Microlunatus sp.]
MSERLRSWAGSRGVDWLRAVVVTGVLLYGAAGESHPMQASDQVSSGHPVPVPPMTAYLLVIVAAMSLAWWRRRPLTMLVVSLAATLTYTALGYVNGALVVAPAIALYAVATVLSWRRAAVIAAVTFVLLEGFTMVFNPPGFGPLGGSVAVLPGLVAAPLFAGIAVASNRARVDAIRERAEFAERTREDEARRRVDEERLRIARELHDVIAHTMATINVQAGVAAHVSTGLPPQVETALTEIKHASKNGLRELRAILAVLRPVDEAENTSPTPRLAELDALLDSVRAAGLDVSVLVTGTRRPLPT